MDVSVDTDILIHLYQAGSQALLFSSFEKIYIYEYLLETEIRRNNQRVYQQVRKDIDRGQIIKITNRFFIERGIKALFDENYREYEILFGGDRGEAYAISLATVLGIEAFVSDDTKRDGPHEILVKELVEEVIPFSFYELLFFEYLRDDLECHSLKGRYEEIVSWMRYPMNFENRMKRVLKRFHKTRGSKRDVQWLQAYARRYHIDLHSKIGQLIVFLKEE